MELKIEVNDEMFKDVAEKSLNALKPEQITEIMQQALLEYFRKDNYKAVESIMVNTSRSDYWNKEPTAFTKRIIESCDMSSLQEVIDKCIDQLKDKYNTILMRILTDMLISGLTNNYAFQESLKNIIYTELSEINNNG